MTKRKTNRSDNQLLSQADRRLPFIQHLYELRRRVFYVAFSVIFWSIIAYIFEHQLIELLLRPAKGEKFIYTSPGGGINFLFSVTLEAGLVLSIPVIVYNLLRFIQPLMKHSLRFTTWGSIISGVLAIAGMAFGYFLGLPAALHFLLHQFTTVQIQPLVTIQSYMSFVAMYMFGSALLFQIPLILLFINRITPLKPRKLFSLAVERWVILSAVILAFLMNPTPNLIDQMIIIGPMILMYQVGVVLVWYINRHSRRSPAVLSLFEQDRQLQAERIQRQQRLKPVFLQSQNPQTPPTFAPQHEPTAPYAQAHNTPARAPRQSASYATLTPARRTFDDFHPARRAFSTPPTES